MNQLDVETEQARIVRVIDFETTGLPEDEGAEIIEVGYVDVDLNTRDFVGFNNRSFFRPKRPITPKTMAIHHITNEDVMDAPPIHNRTKVYRCKYG